MQNSAQNFAKFGRKVRSKIVAKFGREKFGWEKLLQSSAEKLLQRTAEKSSAEKSSAEKSSAE